MVCNCVAAGSLIQNQDLFCQLYATTVSLLYVFPLTSPPKHHAFLVSLIKCGFQTLSSPLLALPFSAQILYLILLLPVCFNTVCLTEPEDRTLRLEWAWVFASSGQPCSLWLVCTCPPCSLHPRSKSHTSLHGLSLASVIMLAAPRTPSVFSYYDVLWLKCYSEQMWGIEILMFQSCAWTPKPMVFT